MEATPNLGEEREVPAEDFNRRLHSLKGDNNNALLEYDGSDERLRACSDGEKQKPEPKPNVCRMSVSVTSDGVLLAGRTKRVLSQESGYGDRDRFDTLARRCFSFAIH